VTDVKETPKRTAMQVALDAERMARQALDGGEGPDFTGPFDQLRERVSELLAWRDGFLGADGPRGVLKAAERGESNALTLRELVKDVGDIRVTVQKLVNLVPADLWSGRGGALATRQQVDATIDATLAVDERLRNVEEWQAAELDEDNADNVGALRERVAALQHDLASYANAGVVDHMIQQLRERVDMVERKTHGMNGPRSAQGDAPHVLGLIARLQKLVHEIAKGREFKAENQRGETTQRYSFRGIDEAQNAIGSAQREIGLIGPKVTIVEKAVSTTEVNKGSYTQVWTTVSVTARYTFQSPIDGSEWSTEGCGMGRDLGDKAESKALAGAFKYALFHGLNIPVKGVFIDAETEDPRIEREHEQPSEQGRTYGHGQPPTQTAEDRERAAWRDQAGSTPGPVDQDGRDGFDGGDISRRTGRSPAERLDNWTGEEPPQDVQAAARAERQTAQREPDKRSPEELARDALNAVRRAANANEAASVWNWIYQRQLLAVPVDGVPVGQHMLAAIRLLPGGGQVELPGWGQFR
jgi:hypothetical protein